MPMTQLSQSGRRNLPRKPIPLEEVERRRQQRDNLAARYRIIFERIRPSLIKNHYNWYIAIDPDTEEYIIDQTFDGITKKVVNAYGYSNEPKLTMFRRAGYRLLWKNMMCSSRCFMAPILLTRENSQSSR